MIPYPEGSLVRLSNGDIAVINKVNTEFPLRPQIKIIKKFNDQKEMIDIDLIREKNLTIVGVHYDDPME